MGVLLTVSQDGAMKTYFVPVSVCVLLLVTSCRSCEDGLMYRGQCTDVYSPVCPRGNRLFSGERGVYCDCDTPQGWLRHRGECYQDLTPVPALCGQHKIIQVSSDNGRQSYSYSLQDISDIS